MNNTAIPRTLNLRWRWEGKNNDFIIYQHPVTAFLDMLNPVAAKIFCFCNGKNTIEDIADLLMKEFKGADKETIIQDVKNFVEHMVKEEIAFVVE